MGLEPNTFAAVYVSRKPLYSVRRFLARRELLGYDCTFKFYPGGGTVKLRILKENSLLLDLKPQTVYHFQCIDGVGFRRVDGSVTDLKTAKIYQVVK